MSAAQLNQHAHGDHWHAHPSAGAHRHLRHPQRSAPGARATGGPLSNVVYRRMYIAQLVALVGTGISTVALGLLAYDLAGANAGAVLGAALALKMVAYVGLSPVIAALAHRVDRRRLLITLDVVRAGVMFALPFVTHVWQVFVLIFVVNACAAGFAPAFQASIPDVLPDERDYTKALSFSRLAYDLGELLSPAIAAAMLAFISFQNLFALNGLAFVASAALLLSITIPKPQTGRAVSDRTWARITLGARRYLATPRLRALLALNLAVAAASAMTIVNTVVLVRDHFNLGASSVAIALGAAGAGSIATALLLPRLLDHTSDRTLMLTGGVVLSAGLPLVAVLPSYATLLLLWIMLGVGLSLVQTPAGRLIQRSADPEERPALFAAQFSLSHLCWLATYPIAGVLGSITGTPTIAIVLAAIAASSTSAAALLWPTDTAATT